MVVKATHVYYHTLEQRCQSVQKWRLYEMMKKIANIIVKSKYWLLIGMILLTVAGLFFMQKVEINEDLTKYLSNDSSMKIGLDIINDEFPAMAETSSIRVMFDDLSNDQKSIVKEKLASIKYVDSVDYDSTSADYNKDNHTLFVLNTSYDYGSTEEKAIEAELNNSFTEYTMVWNNNDTGMPDVPIIVYVVAVIILLIILFAMCKSWAEPFLFLIVIGCAIAINMGSNIIMGSISSVTFSIAALLQLVLSMDYSIMLTNRYHQERTLNPDKNSAMKAAISNSFASIASSSLTTVVGLLMLIFMSFKIGLDLGIVLAKGVFISMVCVITILPGLLIICDKLLTRTMKKPLNIPMGWASKFSFKLRHVLTVVLVLLFAGTFILQQQTGIAYTLEKDDAVAKVFRPENTIVLVYENKDESAASNLTNFLEKDTNIKEVSGYSNTLGLPYTATDLASKAAEMSDDLPLSAELINVLYYSYRVDGQTGKMTAEEFLKFLDENVKNNEIFSSYIDTATATQLNMISRFSNSQALITPLASADMATFFGMSIEQVNNLYLLYFMQNGGVTIQGQMLPTFINFILNEVATNPAYSGMFTTSSLAQLTQLSSTYASKTAMSAQYTTAQASQLLGLPEAMIQGVYLSQLGNISGTMQIPNIIACILNDPAMCASLGEANVAQLQGLQAMIGGVLSDTVFSPAQLSSLLGLQIEQINQLCLLYTSSHGDTSTWKIAIKAFINYLTADVLTNPAYSTQFDAQTAASLTMANRIVNAVVSKQAYSSAEMTTLFSGISEKLNSDMIDLLYLYSGSIKNADATQTMSIETFFNYLTNTVIKDNRFSAFIDSSMKQKINEAGQSLQEGKNQLVSEEYSRLIITSTYPEESTETTAFIDDMNTYCSERFEGEYHFVGNSAMAQEMQKSFDNELLFITLLTALAIFIIVAITFKSVIIPAILVLIVQCGVFITISVTGFLSGSIFYLALLIVECILMGATIDYAILLTNYYREARISLGIKDSLKTAYEGSSHTILTSGMILVIITAILGYLFKDETVKAIIKTISIGSFCAVILILFILPGVLASLDRIIIRKKKNANPK